MIKRVTTALFTLFILVITTGVTISLHYCGTNLRSVSIAGEADSCCDIPSGCCHDEVISIHVDNDITPARTADMPAPISSLLAVIIPSEVPALSETNQSPSRFLFPPPPLKREVLAMHQSFLL